MTLRMNPRHAPLSLLVLACGLGLLLCPATAHAETRVDGRPEVRVEGRMDGHLNGRTDGLKNAEQSLVFQADAAVPMRDGVLLRADILRPAGSGPFPALLCRTPYGKDTDPDELRFARRAVERGYAVVLQDVRGRFASGGEFEPHRNEGRDGHDSVEWVAAQPWCDGRVGTFGLSYPGSAQWLAALEEPPHLKAMAPAMTYSSLRQAIYPGGVFDLDWARWTLVAMAPDLRARKNLPGPKTGRAARADWKRRGPDHFQGHLPLLAQPDLTRPANGAPGFYAEWLRHPPNDPWWGFGDLAGRYGRVQAAVLNLSGWHDDSFSIQGAIANHLGLLAARTGSPAGPRSMLVLGPWSHGINAITGDADFSARGFGATAHLDYDALVLDFMDLHVRGLRNHLAQVRPVRYFLMGENQWREDDSWPPAQTKELVLHLDRRAPGLRHNALSPEPPAADAGASVFEADPARPVREVPGSDLGAWDHSSLDEQEDLLSFETAPLPRDTRVAGHTREEIQVSTDAPDLDLHVKLLAVQADGTAYNLMDSGAEVLRASLRPGAQGGQSGAPRTKALLEPGRVYRLDLDSLLTANTFRKGESIRVVLCASWFPGLSRNLQTGESETVSAVTRAATITVHHNAAHQSRLILPVLP